MLYYVTRSSEHLIGQLLKCVYDDVAVHSGLLTSHYNGGGLLGRVSYVVAGNAAVHPRLVGRDGRQCERAPLHYAPLRQALVAADPGENGRRLPTCGDAH